MDGWRSAAARLAVVAALSCAAVKIAGRKAPFPKPVDTGLTPAEVAAAPVPARVAAALSARAPVAVSPAPRYEDTRLADLGPPPAAPAGARAEVSAAPELGSRAASSTLVPFEPLAPRAAKAAELAPLKGVARTRFPHLQLTGSVSGLTEVRVGPDGRRYLAVADGARFFPGATMGGAPRSRSAPSPAGRTPAWEAPAGQRSDCAACDEGLASRSGTYVGTVGYTSAITVRGVGRCGEGYIYEVINNTGGSVGGLTLTSDASESWDIRGLPPGGTAIIRSNRPISGMEGRWAGF